MTPATGAEAEDPVVIRLPLAYRLYLAVFVCIWCGSVLAIAIVGVARSSPAALIPFSMFAFGLALSYRLIRRTVVLGPADLVVRNFVRTRRVARAEVEGFRVGSVTNQPFMRTIYLLLHDGSVLPLDVASRVYFTDRSKAVLTERMCLLQTWLDSR